MKVEVIEREEKKEVMTFPVLMKRKDSSLVVLFKENGGGTVMVATSVYPTGWYSEDWVSCLNDSIWQKFTGKITLENE